MAYHQLVCFPPVAASSMLFMKWQPGLGKNIKVIPIEFAGRGIRYRESPMCSFLERRNDLIDQIGKKVSFEHPYSFLGICFSDIFIYDIYRQFVIEDRKLPENIFITSSGTPDVQCARKPLQNVAPETLQYVFRNLFKFRNGESESIRDALFHDMMTVYDSEADREERQKADCNLLNALSSSEPDSGNLHAYESFKKMVNAMFEDSRIMHTYVEEQPMTKFKCPVTMFAGKYDTITPVSDAKAWEKYCDSKFEFIEIEGGHTALIDNSNLSINFIKERLEDKTLQAKEFLQE